MPGMPGTPTITGSSPNQTLQWTAPRYTGTSSLVSYTIYYKPTSKTNYATFATLPSASTSINLNVRQQRLPGRWYLQSRIRALTNQSYDWVVLASNGSGAGRVSPFTNGGVESVITDSRAVVPGPNLIKIGGPGDSLNGNPGTLFDGHTLSGAIIPRTIPERRVKAMSAPEGVWCIAIPLVPNWGLTDGATLVGCLGPLSSAQAGRLGQRLAVREHPGDADPAVPGPLACDESMVRFSWQRRLSGRLASSGQLRRRAASPGAPTWALLSGLTPLRL